MRILSEPPNIILRIKLNHLDHTPDSKTCRSYKRSLQLDGHMSGVKHNDPECDRGLRGLTDLVLMKRKGCPKVTCKEGMNRRKRRSR